MKRLFSSLAFRLISLYGILFTLLAFLLLAVYYWMTIHAPYNNVRSRIDAEATILAALKQGSDNKALQAALDTRAAADGVHRPFHALIDPRGHVITANLPEWPQQADGPWLRLAQLASLDGETQDIEPLLRDQVFADGTRLLVGRNIEDIDELEEKLLSVALGVAVTGAALGLLGGWLMSRTIARRIGAVTVIATDVMDGNLSGRIPLTGQSDDFDRLSSVLNEMLSRIEELVESVRRVSDSVAHELRTPLTRLRVTLEPLRHASEGITPAQAEDLLANVAALEKTFDAVLRIARIENAQQAFATESLDLAAVINDAAELYGPAADERGIQLRVDVPRSIQLEGDRDLLFQSICNLLDNAIKYTQQHGQVTITARAVDTMVEIEVRDTGPGIPAPHRAHVTERFYRVPANSAAPGTGLGLSLVAAVAARHHSTLSFEEGSPGLLVRWQLPSSQLPHRSSP